MEKHSACVIGPGPAGVLPPAAASCGVVLPEKGQGLVEGRIVSEQAALEVMARELLTRKHPTIFPGPLVLWDWRDGVSPKAAAVLELAEEIPGVRVIPMPDYRPIYPKIDPEAVINPCHPNLTIWYNKIEVCVFVGVHCHYANITLRMIRAGTSCYTITLCHAAGHEDSMASLPFSGADQVRALTDTIRRLKRQGLRPLHGEASGIQLTRAQRAVQEGLVWQHREGA